MNSFLRKSICIFMKKNASSLICFNEKQFVSNTFHTLNFLNTEISLFGEHNEIFSAFLTWRHMAGHSKWQNVQHIKAEKDRQKNIVTNKYAYLIRGAVRAGGANPRGNHRLEVLIEQAKKENVPNATIENAMKAGNNKKTTFGSMEILVPGGCLVLLEYETDNISSTRHEIKTVCKKYGANILPGEGRWRAAYEQKGIIKVVGCKDGQALNAERALDAAIEAGAEEVQTKEDEMERTVFEFLCAAVDLHPVKKELEQEYEVEDSYVGYVPIVPVQLEKDNMNLLGNFLEELENMSEVVRLFENAK